MGGDVTVSEFELHLCNYIHFRTNAPRERYLPPYLPSMGQIVPLLFSNKDGVGIQDHKTVDVLLKNETKPK